MNGLPLLVSFPSTEDSIQLIGKELSWSNDEQLSAVQLFQKQLPPLVNPRCLPFIFGVSPRLIISMGKYPQKYYRFYSIPKKGGGSRNIEAPRLFLKIIQRWIYDTILVHLVFPSFVTAFVKGRNIFTNGVPHANGINIMVIDIKDFFPSVTFEMAVKVFLGFGYSEVVSRQLASLCCLNGRLPQGAPTSPAIANQAFLPVDQMIYSLAHKWDCNYTRYADDLAFSGSRRFSLDDMRVIGLFINGCGFTINTKKSRIVGAGARQIVAGLVVNHYPQPPRAKRMIWRAIFHRSEKHPIEFTRRIRELQGISAFVNQYNPSLSGNYQLVIQKVINVSSQRKHK